MAYVHDKEGRAARLIAYRKERFAAVSRDRVGAGLHCSSKQPQGRLRRGLKSAIPLSGIFPCSLARARQSHAAPPATRLPDSPDGG